ncbi:hypothetical protein BDN67DRAFT_127585 [Paxillus ammoniavirescens]|nr:hypothetical protein BDN67DRAFT_127585 [Paxillus ammoniavirescens]
MSEASPKRPKHAHSNTPAPETFRLQTPQPHANHVAGAPNTPTRQCAPQPCAPTGGPKCPQLHAIAEHVAQARMPQPCTNHVSRARNTRKHTTDMVHTPTAPTQARNRPKSTKMRLPRLTMARSAPQTLPRLGMSHRRPSASATHEKRRLDPKRTTQVRNAYTKRPLVFYLPYLLRNMEFVTR